MITIDNKTYRNLQEQVQKNKTDIASFKDIQFVLNNMGITVLGKVVTVEEIPEREYVYGDAWLVGTTERPDIYIYTRTDVEGEGQFINMGPLTVSGPQGPQGPQGAAGTDGHSINVTSGEFNPSIQGTEGVGDLYVNTDLGTLWKFDGIRWEMLATIKGNDGSQGPQGPQGATGTTLSIVNKLSSTELLPTDFSSGNIPKNSAYLINGHLWIILGEQGDYSTWRWSDAGDFNLGSVVYLNDVFQASVNLDDYATSSEVSGKQDSLVDSDDIIVNDDNTLTLQNDIKDTIDNALVKPATAPTGVKLVAIDTNNAQQLRGISGNYSDYSTGSDWFPTIGGLVDYVSNTADRGATKLFNNDSGQDIFNDGNGFNVSSYITKDYSQYVLVLGTTRSSAIKTSIVLTYRPGSSNLSTHLRIGSNVWADECMIDYTPANNKIVGYCFKTLNVSDWVYSASTQTMKLYQIWGIK